jgi:hypothetical protein
MADGSGGFKQKDRFLDWCFLNTKVFSCKKTTELKIVVDIVSHCGIIES